MTIFNTPAIGKLRSKDEMGVRDEISSRVRLALSRMESQAVCNEVNDLKAFVYPQPLFLTPADDRGVACGEDSLVALGRHLTEAEISLFHLSPLPERQYIVSLEWDEDRWVGLLAEVAGSTTIHGWHATHLRFLRSVNSPISTMATSLENNCGR